MEESFVISLSRQSFRGLFLYVSLILLLFVPPTLRAQDISDLKQRAEKGDAAAQVDLGFAYEDGKGVAEDFPEAIKWYRKAAEQGSDTGRYCLATIYRFGRGVPKDIEEARKWYPVDDD